MKSSNDHNDCLIVLTHSNSLTEMRKVTLTGNLENLAIICCAWWHTHVFALFLFIYKRNFFKLIHIAHSLKLKYNFPHQQTNYLTIQQLKKMGSKIFFLSAVFREWHVSVRVNILVSFRVNSLTRTEPVISCRVEPLKRTDRFVS